MEAVLRSQDFEIDPVDPAARKFVPADQDTEWLWQVTPKKSGDLRLFLTLYAIIDVAGKEGPVKVGTFHRTLKIHVTWTQRAGDFFKSNWKWLWTAVLVPVALWAIRKRAERKPPAAPSPVMPRPTPDPRSADRLEDAAHGQVDPDHARTQTATVCVSPQPRVERVDALRSCARERTGTPRSGPRRRRT